MVVYKLLGIQFYGVSWMKVSSMHKVAQVVLWDTPTQGIVKITAHDFWDMHQHPVQWLLNKSLMKCH